MYFPMRDGFAFTFPFREAAAEQAREKLMEPLLKLREDAKKAKTAGQLGCAADYMDRLEAAKKLEQALARAQKAGLMESAEWNAQVADKDNAYPGTGAGDTWRYIYEEASACGSAEDGCGRRRWGDSAGSGRGCRGRDILIFVSGM